jgi:hypothetical protein
MSRPADEFHLFVLAGPAVGFKLSSSLKLESEPDTRYEFRSTDLGIVFGVGLAAVSRVLFELRWTWGLSKIVEALGTPRNVKNGVMAFIAGYRF